MMASVPPTGSEAPLEALLDVLRARRGADPAESYVASLYARGSNAILKKIGEEATEVLLAAKDGDAEALVHELADLWFHCLVLMAERDLPLRALTDEPACYSGRLNAV
jgi:phosphoribosyl-ATP pyrophosphohydrolase